MGTIVFISGKNGIQIAVETFGCVTDPALVFIHGGGQTRHSWDEAAESMRDHGYFVVNVDLRGHGDSQWSSIGDYSLDAHTDDIIAVIDHFKIEAVLIGASLGGLAALLIAGEHQHLEIRGLVLVDVLPNIAPDGAQEIVEFMRANTNGFASIKEAADVISDYIPHRPRPTSLKGLEKNLRLLSDGKYYWHWDPEMLNGSNDATEQTERLEQATRDLKMPTILIRGAKSRVVTDDGVEAFRKLNPHAKYANIANADHMVAGDNNSAFLKPLVSFLKNEIFNSD